MKIGCVSREVSQEIAIKRGNPLNIDLKSTFDTLSQDVLINLRPERGSFYVAAAVDSSGKSTFYDAGQFLRYFVNAKGEENPANRAEIKAWRIYELKETSTTMTSFSSQKKTMGKVYYASIIALQDQNLTPDQKKDTYRLLSELYQKGSRGAPKNKELARHYEGLAYSS